MTYNAQGIGKSGARKRLVEEVVKQAEYWAEYWADCDSKNNSFECMRAIYIAVDQYKKETSK